MGTLSAGLSSIFPGLLIVSLMLGDFNTVKLDIQSNRFKWITGIAILFALSIPLFGFNPIQGQIFTQVFNVFALPLEIICILALWNRNGVGLPSNRIGTNIILMAALVFSIIIMYQGLLDILT